MTGTIKPAWMTGTFHELHPEYRRKDCDICVESEKTTVETGDGK